MNEPVAPTDWIDAGPEIEIELGHPKLVRHGDHHVLIVRGEDQALYAIENRCPHEGYPLRQGYVRGCTLTCPWHNFKFDLRDGTCLKGDEAVQSFPVRVHEGRVHLDVRSGDPTRLAEARLLRLEEAMLERRLGQAARDIVRLLQLGVPSSRLAAFVAAFDAKRAEYGSSHALAVAADVLDYLPRYSGTDAVLPLMQIVDLASEAGVRRPVHASVTAQDPGSDPARAGKRFVVHVEAEAGEAAEGLLRGAIAKGWRRAELEPWFFHVVSHHFLDFGHALIYHTKVFDLLDRTGWEFGADILAGFLRGIVSGTRENLLPRWKWIRDAIGEHEGKFEHWWQANRRVNASTRTPLRECFNALTSGTREDVVRTLVAALESHVGFDAVTDAFVAAASERLIRFEVAHDADPTLQDGWLDVTHCLTVATALRQALRRSTSSSVMCMVFFVARFVHNAAALDRHESATSNDSTFSLPLRDDAASLPDRLFEAVAQGEADAAMAILRAWWAGHPNESELLRVRATFDDLPLTDRYTRPIVAAHALKVSRVAFDELHELRETPWALHPLLACVRFVASPIRERPIARLAHEAQRLVVQGDVPRTLT